MRSSRSRLKPLVVCFASLALVLVLFQNFSLPAGISYASDFPMGTLRTDPSLIVDLKTKAGVFMNTSQINHAIYMGYKDQAMYLKYSIGTEYGGGTQFENSLNMMAESNYFFNAVSGFNQLVPKGLPKEAVHLVYRASVFGPRDAEIDAKVSTMSLVLAPVSENGVIVYRERLLTCGHCFERQLEPGTTIRIEGPNNSRPIIEYTLSDAEINRINSQLAGGYLSADSRDYVFLTPPSAISTHRDVVEARGASMIPIVDGGILSQISSETPLYSPGYSSIYNSGGIIESPTRLGVRDLRNYYDAGRVQPNTQIQYKTGTFKGVMQTMSDVSGGNLLTSSGHSGGPIIAMRNGKPYVVAVHASE